MNWESDNNNTTDKMIELVEKRIKFNFPEDFKCIIKQYDGGYPEMTGIMVDGQAETFNNLISFQKDDISYILDVLEETDSFKETRLVPIGEDPGGNLFCYQRESLEIVFWESETGVIRHVCSNFSELIDMLFEEDDEEED